MPIIGPNTLSTLTVQNLIDYARLFPWTTPALGVAGYSDEPALSFADDIMKKILAKSNPWPWNAAKFPAIQTQPYQQDYPTNISQTTMGWLQSAVMIDINSTSTPKVIPPLTVVRALLPTFLANAPQKVAWIPNQLAQTGSWPGPLTPYVNPLSSQGGGPSNNPLTAITDPNGNIQVVTTYGVTGGSQPAWPAATSPGGTVTVDGSVTWTVADPNGVALRLDALATNNSIVWEIRSLFQVKPPNVTSLSQTMAPIPDDLSYLVKQGFLAYTYKQSDNNKFQIEYAQWLQAIQEAMGASDREYQEFGFYPAQPLQGGTSDGATGLWSYPGFPGWS
jgi:hypothetical protein